MKLPFYLPITILLLLSTVFGAGDVKKLVFEDQLIEGKIRRPQLVLIKADQRPVFNSMVLQSKGKAADISAAISDDIIQEFPYKGPFRIENSKITNIEP
ncbi:MAG TPA: hypothetical protein PLE24_13175 [Chitinispirillaceae bacterium]|jgi:hypothetical protein|nr:hypothetical protein [Chitinispirillaceae bacterium]